MPIPKGKADKDSEERIERRWCPSTLGLCTQEIVEIKVQHAVKNTEKCFRNVKDSYTQGRMWYMPCAFNI